jgi:hypothetical protein
LECLYVKYSNVGETSIRLSQLFFAYTLSIRRKGAGMGLGAALAR